MNGRHSEQTYTLTICAARAGITGQAGHQWVNDLIAYLRSWLLGDLGTISNSTFGEWACSLNFPRVRMGS